MRTLEQLVFATPMWPARGVPSQTESHTISGLSIPYPCPCQSRRGGAMRGLGIPTTKALCLAGLCKLIVAPTKGRAIQDSSRNGLFP